jgi:two-component system, chemotaxis family, protein-glutamate methylesterase/glutaminase
VGDECKIVVIGASLGGLNAIVEVMRDIPPEFPAPIAFVQHRSASDPDTLVRLLRRQTKLQVKEPSDKEEIVPATLYLAPADYHLIVEPGAFALSTGPAVSYARPSIDVLFESAADSYGVGTIGVILTGANHDGAAGVARIKSRGGRILVQDPQTAECGVMPRSAIQATKPDQILLLHEICEALIYMCRPSQNSLI